MAIHTDPAKRVDKVRFRANQMPACRPTDAVATVCKCLLTPRSKRDRGGFIE